MSLGPGLETESGPDSPQERPETGTHGHGRKGSMRHDRTQTQTSTREDRVEHLDSALG